MIYLILLLSIPLLITSQSASFDLYIKDSYLHMSLHVPKAKQINLQIYSNIQIIYEIQCILKLSLSWQCNNQTQNDSINIEALQKDQYLSTILLPIFKMPQDTCGNTIQIAATQMKLLVDDKDQQILSMKNYLETTINQIQYSNKAIIQTEKYELSIRAIKYFGDDSSFCIFEIQMPQSIKRWKLNTTSDYSIEFDRKINIPENYCKENLQFISDYSQDGITMYSFIQSQNNFNLFTQGLNIINFSSENEESIKELIFLDLQISESNHYIECLLFGGLVLLISYITQ